MKQLNATRNSSMQPETVSCNVKQFNAIRSSLMNTQQFNES